MRKVAFLTVTWVALAGIESAWADRPGSYDGVISGSGRRQGSLSGVVGHPSRGPHRHGYQWGGNRWVGNRSLSLFVGPVLGPPIWPMFGPNVWFGPGYFGGWGPAGIYFNPATNFAEYYLPPVYAPAELAYGPLATERFLGVARDPIVMPGPVRPGAASGDALEGKTGVDAEPEKRLADKLRKSNNAARERALQFMAYGDALFAQQRIHEASQRYKSALEAAPDLPQVYYRQGFALIAINQFALAARALRIAVELDPELAGESFRLDDLYQDNQLAKNAHLEQLAAEALERSDSGDLLFLVGMFLYCDAQGERAQKFLQKAVALGGDGSTFIVPLLDARPVPVAVPRAGDGRGDIDI